MDFYSEASSRPFTHGQISWNLRRYVMLLSRLLNYNYNWVRVSSAHSDMCNVQSIRSASKFLTVCRYSATSSGGHSIEDVQSLIFSFAATAAGLFFLRGKFLDNWSFFILDSSTVVDFLGGVVALTSRGYSFAIGRLVQPVLVLMFAARTSPSWPVIRLSIIASLQLMRFVSSWTCTTSPTFTATSFLPVVL